MLGESHGECVGTVIDGCPAGLELKVSSFATDLSRRRDGEAFATAGVVLRGAGNTKGTTPRKESDLPHLASGIFNDHTTGAPILILFENKNADPAQYEKTKDTPRPGHADLVSREKFGGFNDYRGGGHFSGRLTAGLVAGGVLAKKILEPLKIRIEAKLIGVGGVDASDVAPARDSAIESEIDSVMKAGDSIGGVIECRVKGLPAGLGEPFFDSAESLISHMIFAIPGVKGIEFGAGFACARMRGSEFNDEILNKQGQTSTNNSGGINGGITNSNELVFRVAIRPTSSIAKPQRTVNLRTGKQIELTVSGRHDACIALRVPVVLEAATAIVLVDLMLLEGKLPRVLGNKL